MNPPQSELIGERLQENVRGNGLRNGRAGHLPMLPENADIRYRRDLHSRRYWRKRIRGLLRWVALVSGDLAVVAAAAWLAASGDRSATYSLFVISAPLMTLAQASFRTYGPREGRRNYEGASLAVLLVAAILLVVREAQGLPAIDLIHVAGFAVAGAIGAPGVRWVAHRISHGLYRRSIGRKRTLVVGGPHRTWEILTHLREAGAIEYEIVGHLVEGSEDDPTALGTVDQLAEVMESERIDRVIISSHFDGPMFRELVYQCFLLGAEVSVVPATLNDMPYRVGTFSILGWPLLELRMPKLHALQVVLKRGMDIVISAIGLVVSAPVFAGIAVAVKLDSPGPVLFRQMRPGLGGRTFEMLKFRTMRPDAEQVLKQDPDMYQEFLRNDCKLPEGSDPRVSWVGAWLRKTSLDELPQLINVLRGEMSIVGPRPLVGPELNHYGEWAPYFLSVKPGITGYWQVMGRSAVAYPERARLDIKYIQDWSLLLDCWIVLRTLPRVVSGTGAH